MKTDDILILGVGLLAAFFILKRARPASSVAPSQSAGWVSEITNNADPSEPGWGWSYYSNGTAISPQGEYWYQGRKL